MFSQKVKNTDVTQIDNRDYLFDNIKALLIFLVVVGHITNLGYYHNDKLKTIYVFIYFFHMPAFIFISGYFSKNVDKCRETAVRNFLIPYILMVLFYYVQIKMFPLPTQTNYMLRIFSPPTGCWYLFTMFIWKLFLKDLSKVRFCIPLLYAFGLLAGYSEEFGSKMNLGRLSVYTVFFMLGYFMNEKHVYYIRRVPKVVSVALIYVLYRISKYYVMVENIPIKLVMNKKDYRDNVLMDDLKFRFVYYIVATVSILVLINLFTKRKTILSKIGRNTYTVYFFHLVVVRIIDLNFKDFVPFKENTKLYFAFILVVAAITTFIFSRDICIRLFTKFLDFVNRIIFRKSTT